MGALGYKSRNAVSHIEVGIEGLPAKRAYAWANILEVPRDPFFRFVTGEAERVEIPKANARNELRTQQFITSRRISLGEAAPEPLAPSRERRFPIKCTFEFEVRSSPDIGHHDEQVLRQH
jgi:hypothetical protein